MLDRIGFLYRRLRRHGRAEGQLESELHYHLTEQIEANLAAGMSEDEARRQAMLAFGGVERFKEECRDVRPFHLLTDLGHDLRYAVRLLRKHSAASAVVGLSMAIGIGSCTAILTFMNGILLRPPPLYRQPHELVLINETPRERPSERRDTSAAAYRAWRELDELAGGFAAVHGPYTGSARYEDYPVSVSVQAMSSELLPLLGVQPSLGRGFLPDDDREGAAPVALISDQLWRRQFGASAKVMERDIWVEGRSRRIVGVLPERFWFYGPGTDIFIPLQLSASEQDPSIRRLKVVARLRPAHAAEELSAAALAKLQAIEQNLPAGERGARVAVVPLVGNHLFAEQARGAIYILTLAVSLTLLVVCMNVAIAMTARWAARQREIAVRKALGAGTLRVVRQFLVESTVLAVLGGAGGLFLAWAVFRALLAIAPPEAALYDFRLDLRLLGWTSAISILTGLVSGIVPALAESGVNVNEQLKQGSASGPARAPRQRLRRVLVGAQIAIAFALLVTIGAMVHSYQRYRSVDPGFEKSDLLMFRLRVSPDRVPASIANDPRASTEWVVGFYERVSESLRLIPGIQSVAHAAAGPLWEGDGRRRVTVAGESGSSVSTQPATVAVNHVSFDYLRATGMKLQRGRFLARQDTEGSPWVAVINQTMERTWFPGRNALGRFLTLEGEGERPREIVGVVSDTMNRGITRPPAPLVYAARAQQPAAVAAGTSRRAAETWFLVRSAHSSSAVAEQARKQVARVDPEQAISHVATMVQIMEQGAREMLVGVYVTGGIIAFAMFLAALGVYGVLSYAVSRRTRELGIRVALGASGTGILRLIVGEGMRLAAAGLMVGVAGAMAADRLIASESDAFLSAQWPVVTVAALIVLGSALVACYFPARRATRIDPMVALRSE